MRGFGPRAFGLSVAGMSEEAWSLTDRTIRKIHSIPTRGRSVMENIWHAVMRKSYTLSTREEVEEATTRRKKNTQS